tara:strand:+ start:26 stop:208 length:183 start_codon:yes stop_codon:yes gene_type:complete
MTKQEVHKWLNERADQHLAQHNSNIKDIRELSNVDISTRKLVAKITAIEELLADLIEKHF